MTGVGLLTGILALLPRIEVAAASAADPTNPFPPSITITNGPIPLRRVSVSIRPCVIILESGSEILGRDQCTGPSADHHPFEVTHQNWRGHKLQIDEKWTIPDTNAPIRVAGLKQADVSIVIKFWPQYLPQFWFSDREKEVHLVTAKGSDGTLIWIPKPVD